MTTPLEQLTRSLADQYTVQRELGAGGMATVYLAQDIRHSREVAIKVLRADIADRVGAERFLREIRTTASLQHPHIVPLYDSGVAGGTVYYVMPYVRGESLRDRLRREGQLAVADAVRITQDIADALDYAHRQGFVHRDVKPENILLQESRALIADFGIALALGAGGRSLRLTESGMSIGTPQYMSPEQAMGEKYITARTDIFALGAMLYEMLAGEPPFTGETAQVIVAKMMASTPTPIQAIRPSVPVHISDAIDGALQKVAADRFGSAADFALSLVESTATARARVTSATTGRTDVSPRRSALRLALMATSLVIAAVVGGVIARSIVPSSVSTATVARAVIPLARDQLISKEGLPLSVSRDGTFFVYVGDDSGKAQLFIRQLADTIPRLLPNTEGARTPVISPDGAWIAFFADTKLRKLPRSGGSPITVADNATNEFGGYWSATNDIVFSRGDSGLYRVPANGGAPAAMVAEPSLASRRHSLGALKWPAPLPDRNQALVTTDSGVAVMDLTSGSVHVLFRGKQARYLPTKQLIFDDDEGRVRVVGFDASNERVSGTSIPVLEVFRGPGGGAAFFALSDNGTLVFLPGGFQRTLLRVDRFGRETPINVGVRGYRFPSVSPNGKRLAVTIDPRPSAIWLLDLEHDQITPLTTDRVHSITPVWSPDGTRIALQRSGKVVWMQAEAGAKLYPVLGTQAEGRVGVLGVSEWTRVGFFGFQRNSKAEQVENDLVQFQMGDSTVASIVASPASDWQAALSPDGKWLAYTSNSSGANEVYVRPFPAAGASTRVSSRGGVVPHWSTSGNEILYRAGTHMMSATVRTKPDFAVVGVPQTLFSGPFDFSQDRNWSPSVDGTFIMIKADPTMGRQLHVVLNWFQEIETLGRK